MSDIVTLVEQETFCSITLDDGKANAIGFDMLVAINNALDSAEAMGKPVVIAGRPGKFSAGFDLAVMQGSSEGMVKLLSEGAELSRRLLAHPSPVVLAVTGHALAMGAIMLMSADYRVGARGEFKIGLNEVAIGLTMPWFGVEIAEARLSKTHYHRAVDLGWIYDADGAVEAGFLDEVVEPGMLEERAEAVAAQLGGLDAKAHRETKLRTRDTLLTNMASAIESELNG